ncbi:hypothetical protein ACFQMN_03775 [Halobacillus campisalis]|uniref:Uncharacterized protein n=1 Tax=Halobacillus campisalis TaxID=435909 RepID=A0ABW2K1L9_9BACI
MSDKKLLFVFGWAYIVSTLLYFLLYSGKYTQDEMFSGVVFAVLAAPIYFLCVFLYYKNQSH